MIYFSRKLSNNLYRFSFLVFPLYLHSFSHNFLRYLQGFVCIFVRFLRVLEIIIICLGNGEYFGHWQWFSFSNKNNDNWLMENNDNIYVKYWQMTVLGYLHFWLQENNFHTKFSKSFCSIFSSMDSRGFSPQSRRHPLDKNNEDLHKSGQHFSLFYCLRCCCIVQHKLFVIV